MNLTSKLIAVFLLLSIVPLSLVGYLSYSRGRHAIERDTVNSLLTNTLLKEAEFKQWIDDSESDTRLLAQRPLVRQYAAVLVSRDPANPEYQAAYDHIYQDHFLPRLEESGNFLDFTLIRASDGLVMVSTYTELEGKYREDRAFFIEGQQATYVGNIEYEVSLNEQVMYISTPVKDSTDTVIAVLAGHLNLADISTIMTRRSGLRQTEATYVVNAFNFVVTENQSQPDFSLNTAVYSDGVNDCLAGHNNSGFYNNSWGVPVIGAYRWMPDRQLCIISEIDQSEALAPIIDLRNSIALIGVIIGLGVMLVGAFFARTMTRPILRLVKGTREVATGNLEYRVGTTVKDEIGQLSRAFDQMTETLNETTYSRNELDQAVKDRTAQLQASNKELEAFSYSVSHDLRAPLRAMDGFSNILLEEYAPELPEEAQRYLGLVRDNARQMGNLIDHLLAFSRLGRQTLKKGPVMPSDIVHHVVEDLSAELEGRQVEITVGDMPPCEADPTLLRQVYANLIGNAVKFTKKRDVALIEVGSRSQDGSTVYFVKDNGVGFDMQYSNKLFGVFQRLHRAEEYEGTGVGLATVQRIIHRHGGRIWAESEIDHGTTFSFIIKEERSQA